MTEKSGKVKNVSKSGKSGGRPKGSKNLGGPLFKRIINKAEKQLDFMDRLHGRAERWASVSDEGKKEILRSISQSVAAIYKSLDEDVVVQLKALDSEGFTPPKIAAAAIDYAIGRQVWIKATQQKTYEEGFGYDASELANLFVVKTVGGKVLVSVGKNGKMRIPVPKLHISVKNPAEESQAA